MALSVSEVYHLSGTELRSQCVERGLDSSGPVRLLRERLSDYIKSETRQPTCTDSMAQASKKTDGVEDVQSNPPELYGISNSHDGHLTSHGHVVLELLRRVSPLTSEEHTHSRL
jgi:hypothetical protein